MYQLISEQSIYHYFGEDEPNMIREMIQIILNTNIRDLAEMDDLFDQKNFSAIKKRCHKAKPSMSYIGAQKTRKLLEEIENNPPNYQIESEKLKAQLTIIETELNQFLATIN